MADANPIGTATIPAIIVTFNVPDTSGIIPNEPGSENGYHDLLVINSFIFTLSKKVNVSMINVNRIPSVVKTDKIAVINNTLGIIFSSTLLILFFCFLSAINSCTDGVFALTSCLIMLLAPLNPNSKMESQVQSFPSKLIT